MSQQELPPEQKKQQSGNDEDIDSAQPYYWSTQPAQPAQSGQSRQPHVGPKDEPAGSYDEPAAQYDYGNDYASGYQPQNETISSYPASNSGNANAIDADAAPWGQGQRQQQQQQQQFQSREQGRSPYSPDGDAFETGYRPYERPYNSYGNEGGWQQQQQQQVPPWMRPQRNRGNFRWIWIVLFILMFAGPTIRFAGDALAVLFPILFIGLIVVASAVFWSTIGSRRGRGPRGPGGWGGRRGPWGW